MNKYYVLGAMSGSSLDGLDVACIHFSSGDEGWDYEFVCTETLEIPKRITDLLQIADELPSLDLYKLDVQYGQWIGEKVLEFAKKNAFQPELIGIHGHTVFHEPQDKVSIQIGNAQLISQITHCPVIDNFRAPDVLKGGQGAPLVPAGEHHLFSEYQGFVNLGGIANIAVHKDIIHAWDVAPCNQILNHFARQLGHTYDKGGNLARSGSRDETWHQQIANLSYFKQPPPKSLSNQWREKILQFDSPVPANALKTYTDFLATRIGSELLEHLPASARVLITGGGAYNAYLIEQIRQHTSDNLEIVVPDHNLIEFKEALVFGFLGLLRMLGQPNVFCSATGASSDTVAGIIYYPK